MKHVRILHCSTSVENYELCVSHRVAGFVKRFGENPQPTVLYFAVKVGKHSYCGARGVLGDLTDEKPWRDAERFVQVFRVESLEFCTPFDLSILSCVDQNWGPKLLLGSKLIRDGRFIEVLEQAFEGARITDVYHFQVDEQEGYDDPAGTPVEAASGTEHEEPEEPAEELPQMIGAFQTIKFKNEQDPSFGLEPLVTRHFYQLFQYFNTENSILIPENRLFMTEGQTDQAQRIIPGIRAIPDALLISFDPEDKKAPLRINLIEYECFGEAKTRATQKFDYLNGHIIPQLIRFASSFSISADPEMKRKTVDNWIDKMIRYISSDSISSGGEAVLGSRTAGWVKALHPGASMRSIDRMLESELRRAFACNIKILLIIDELTTDQKVSLQNIIHSFKLPSLNGQENCIGFSSYVVRLEQEIRENGTGGRYALSFQE